MPYNFNISRISHFLPYIVDVQIRNRLEDKGLATVWTIVPKGDASATMMPPRVFAPRKSQCNRGTCVVLRVAAPRNHVEGAIRRVHRDLQMTNQEAYFSDRRSINVDSGPHPCGRLKHNGADSGERASCEVLQNCLRLSFILLPDRLCDQHVEVCEMPCDRFRNRKPGRRGVAIRFARLGRRLSCDVPKRGTCMACHTIGWRARNRKGRHAAFSATALSGSRAVSIPRPTSPQLGSNLEAQRKLHSIDAYCMVRTKSMAVHQPHNKPEKESLKMRIHGAVHSPSSEQTPPSTSLMSTTHAGIPHQSVLV